METSDARLRFTATAGEVTGLVLEGDGPEARGRRIQLRERELVFRNGDVSLSGSLVLPDGPGPHPAVVIVHGSGPLTRRGPRYMAHLFAHRGIPALAYDKRGTGRSTGRWQTTPPRWSGCFRSKDVDAARVGLFG